MISIRFAGGLGNQLFQIASTYAHAKDNNFECGFDLSHTDLPLQGSPAIEYARNLYFALPQIKHSDYNLIKYHPKRWEYTPIPPRDNVILDGYFQSPKYFNHRREELLELFINSDVRYGTLNRLQDKYCVELRNSIGLHVRRGDYLKLAGFHPLPSINYYIDAIQYITSKTEIFCILVFSDDINWCKQNLSAYQVRFIEGQRDYEDMLLMSLCNHNIIANSSFSWWGSYFNTNPNKIVCAPTVWNGPKAGHTWNDIYLPEMKIIA